MEEQKICPYCGKASPASVAICQCGESLLGIPTVANANKTVEEKIEEAKNTGDWSNFTSAEFERVASKITLTTSFYLAGKEVTEECGVLVAECAYGMNIFRDFFAAIRDVVGGRSNATEKVLRDARKEVMRQLREQALALGADAVIAMSFNYTELSGGGKNGMLLATAVGTAVKIK